MKRVLFVFLFVGLVFSVGANDIYFTSVPDLFNWNIGYPQEGWEDALDWFFDNLKKDGKDFTLNAGDVMDARWWKNSKQIEDKTAEYWIPYKKRFDDRGITIYIAPGDHEYGDDFGLKKVKLARTFGKQFTKLMGMPLNGPSNHLGRAFYVRKGNLLVISLDTFEDEGDRFSYGVGDEQLKWMEDVLIENKDADFVVVQGHLPIVGPVNSKNSSASMLEGGTDSKLWKLMVKYGVSVYLCGEHHRITVKKCDGIWQIVHGALWGTQTDLNYLRGVVSSNKMSLELVEFDVEYSGGVISDHPFRTVFDMPKECVSISQKNKNEGVEVTGKLVLELEKNGSVVDSFTSGWFKNID